MPDTAFETEIPAEALPPPATQQEAFQRRIEQARALPAGAVRPLGVETRLAYVNALDGHRRITSRLASVRGLSGVDGAAIEHVPELASALLFAQRRVELVAPAKRNLLPRVMRARALRTGLLRQAQAAVSLGLIPRAPVARLSHAHGDLDTAEGLVALAALYAEHAAVLIGGPVNRRLLDEAARTGAALQAELRPSNAPRKVPAKSPELRAAMADRDRLWTLLLHAYDELRRAATFLGVEGVPALHSRKVLRR
jgi:hypothetical protein